MGVPFHEAPLVGEAETVGHGAPLVDGEHVTLSEPEVLLVPDPKQKVKDGKALRTFRLRQDARSFKAGKANAPGGDAQNPQHFMKVSKATATFFCVGLSRVARLHAVASLPLA